MTPTKESYESTNPWNYWKESNLLSVTSFFRLLTSQMLLSLRCYINGIWPAWREDNSPEVKTQFFSTGWALKSTLQTPAGGNAFFFLLPLKLPGVLAQHHSKQRCSVKLQLGEPSTRAWPHLWVSGLEREMEMMFLWWLGTSIRESPEKRDWKLLQTDRQYILGSYHHNGFLTAANIFCLFICSLIARFIPLKSTDFMRIMSFRRNT